MSDLILRDYTGYGQQGKNCDLAYINYEGATKNNFPLWFVTFTNTKPTKYETLQEFRTELYSFLNSIDYVHAVWGAMEYHKTRPTQDKVHGHAILHAGVRPTNNKNNKFVFGAMQRINNNDELKRVVNYINKEIIYTLERDHEIRNGVFYMNHYAKGYNAFGDTVYAVNGPDCPTPDIESEELIIN